VTIHDENATVVQLALSPPCSGSMDDPLQDLGTLASTFAAFQELIEYFAVSPSALATATREQLRQTTHGGDTFLGSLCQDLDDIHAYCCAPDSVNSCDGSAQAVMRSLLICLASMLTSSHKDEVGANSVPRGPKVVVKTLIPFRIQ
jgi:hypothetical protein